MAKSCPLNLAARMIDVGKNSFSVQVGGEATLSVISSPPIHPFPEAEL